jgi:hypothetical protein
MEVAETTVPDWRKRLVCGQCGSRRVEMMVSGVGRGPDQKRSPSDGYRG